MDRLADLVPPPRKHRHRYHGVFAPNHKIRSAVTALAIGNVGKPRDAATGGHAVGGHAADGDATCHGCDSCDKLPSHDTSRRQRPNTWLGWARSFRWSARGVVATSASSRSLPIRGRSGRSLHISANRSNHRPSLPPVAHRPTGESSCRSTTNAT
ncbi:MAG: transposase [Planctomycetia bacterium]|nr:transposase [Planctomycetia bacterium]